MSNSIQATSTATIVARMDSQRAQLHRQFVQEAQAADDRASASLPPATGTAMQPYQPRSMLMRLLVSNPQILQRLLVLAATTVLGARYSSWAVRLMGLFLASRKR